MPMHSSSFFAEYHRPVDMRQAVWPLSYAPPIEVLRLLVESGLCRVL